MKTATMFLIRMYFRVLSALWPVKAGEKAFRLFQRTRKLSFKKAELEFYEQARKFKVVHPTENINAYELGDPHGKLVLLVHGWDSNAGSLGAIAKALVKEGYRVVSLDLPAHGYSKQTHTNLRECREAVRALIYQLRPTNPFSVVSHSFGSAVTTMALAGTRYKVDHFIMLTTPNRLIDVFDEFRNQIGLGEHAYQEVLLQAQLLLNEPVENVNVESKALNVQYDKLTILHDVYDKVLPYSNAIALNKALPNVELVSLHNAGHYRMLWNTQVIGKVLVNLSEVEAMEATENYLEEYVTELLSA